MNKHEDGIMEMSQYGVTDELEKVITTLFAPQFFEEYFDHVYDEFITLTETEKLIEYIRSDQSTQSEYSERLAKGIFSDHNLSSKDIDELLKKSPVEKLEEFLYQTAKYFFGYALLKSK